MTILFEDGQALANLWSIGIVEAKQALGHKIINKLQDLLPSGLQQPTSNTKFSPSDNFQAYVKSEYDYDDADAVLLSTLWSLGAPEAKNEIGFRVITDAEKSLPNKLRENDIPDKHDDENSKLYQAYSKSKYDYDDAAVLAQLWDMPIFEAKYTIGAKVVHKMTETLRDKLNRN